MARRPFQAKFPGLCRECGGCIEPGELITGEPQAWVHAPCPRARPRTLAPLPFAEALARRACQRCRAAGARQVGLRRAGEQAGGWARVIICGSCAAGARAGGWAVVEAVPGSGTPARDWRREGRRSTVQLSVAVPGASGQAG